MNTRFIHIQKWTDDTQAPTEELMRQILVSEGLSPEKWTSDPQEVFSARAHDFDKILYVVDGSIIFGFPIEGEPTTLHPGDRLDLPAGTTHIAVAGERGVVCLEAQRQLK